MTQRETIVQASLSSTSGVQESGTSVVSFVLQNPISLPPHSQGAIALVNMSVPRSWYNVTAATNTLTLNGVDYTVSPANYGATSLASALTAALSTVPVTVTYSSLTLGFVFTSAIPISITYATTTMWKQLGVASDLGPATTLQSDRAIDLAGTRSIHITMTNLPSTLRESFAGGSMGSTLDVVPVTVQAGSIVNFVSQQLRWTPLQNGWTLSSTTVSMLDDSGQLLDLRGADWELTLAVREFPPETIPDMQSEMHAVTSVTEGDGAGHIGYL
jgi:hypothetical protein